MPVLCLTYTYVQEEKEKGSGRQDWIRWDENNEGNNACVQRDEKDSGWNISNRYEIGTSSCAREK